MRLRFLVSVLLSVLLTASFTQNNAKNTPINLEITETVLPPETPTSTPTLTPQPIAGAYGPYEFPENVNPLTGLMVEDPAVLARHPIVVKISNAPALVRPQSGISEADIVFEHYAEGGLTRFSAVFLSHAPTRVGSIRSARLIDHELTAMFHGMLVFSGASIGVEKYIYGSDEVNARLPGSEVVAPARYIPPSEYADRAYKGVAYGLPYYWRDETIPVPHNMFTDLAAIWELAASEGHTGRQPLVGLAFHPDAPPGSSGAATRIDLRYRTTRVLWEYDPSINKYRRSADGQGHFDFNTGQQITADNIVIMYAEHTDTEIIESQFENNISWSTQIAVWGQNDMILFRDGQRYDGYWIRTIREEIIALRTEAGEILYLKPGNTWFQIIREPEQQIAAEEWLNVE